MRKEVCFSCGESWIIGYKTLSNRLIPIKNKEGLQSFSGFQVKDQNIMPLYFKGFDRGFQIFIFDHKIICVVC
jgi:hypothetical protein